MYEMHSYMEILKKKCTWIFLLGMEMGFPTFKVWRLNKSLYGFKQFPWVRFWRFTQSMIKIGYSENQGDDIVHQTLFRRGGKDSKCVCGLIVINRNNLEDIMELKSYMASVSSLTFWLNHGGKGLVGRPCTHESLGWKQRKPGGLVVQTPGAKWGGCGRARCTLRGRQKLTTGKPDAHH